MRSNQINMNPEEQRLLAARDEQVPWKKWGPYLSERQWGAVREDYSEDGDAWAHFGHDQARSRAYRWGEDGLAGFSDERQTLCFALALWNGTDPILKERLFGLSNSEGNHGEDVKEYYFYLDSTPTHSYMKYLYKYPQAEFPYLELIRTNQQRTTLDHDYELLDTGVFEKDRYFDVFVEYAKESPEDILIQITAYNRGPETATLHVLPTLWFRNTWSWSDGAPKPSLQQVRRSKKLSAIAASHRAKVTVRLRALRARRLILTSSVATVTLDGVSVVTLLRPHHRASRARRGVAQQAVPTRRGCAARAVRRRRRSHRGRRTRTTSWHRCRMTGKVRTGRTAKTPSDSRLRRSACCKRSHPVLSAPIHKYGGIRPPLHPGQLRCSSVEYSRYSPSSRLAGRAPRRPRCVTVFADRSTRLRGRT